MSNLVAKMKEMIEARAAATKASVKRAAKGPAMKEVIELIFRDSEPA